VTCVFPLSNSLCLPPLMTVSPFHLNLFFPLILLLSQQVVFCPPTGGSGAFSVPDRANSCTLRLGFLPWFFSSPVQAFWLSSISGSRYFSGPISINDFEFLPLFFFIHFPTHFPVFRDSKILRSSRPFRRERLSETAPPSFSPLPELTYCLSPLSLIHRFSGSPHRALSLLAAPDPSIRPHACPSF